MVSVSKRHINTSSQDQTSYGKIMTDAHTLSMFICAPTRNSRCVRVYIYYIDDFSQKPVR